MANSFVLRCTWLAVKVLYYILPVLSWLLKAAIYIIGTIFVLLLLFVIF